MSVKENIEAILEDLPQEVKLLAVSKTKSVQVMEEAYEYGVRDFGENKVQELIEKIDSFHSDVNWHLIGKLQTNKVKYIVGKVFLIHSLSSIKLLKEIEKEYGKKGKVANVLIQINIGREESKSGFFVEEIDDLILEVEKCKNVKVKGLMTIIPKGDKVSNKNYFRKVKEIYDSLKEKSYNNIVMETLSMGMTHDYMEAIEEGSNLIRVGEGIFGERNYNI